MQQLIELRYGYIYDKKVGRFSVKYRGFSGVELLTYSPYL